MQAKYRALLATLPSGLKIDWTERQTDRLQTTALCGHYQHNKCLINGIDH